MRHARYVLIAFTAAQAACAPSATTRPAMPPVPRIERGDPVRVTRAGAAPDTVFAHVQSADSAVLVLTLPRDHDAPVARSDSARAQGDTTRAPALPPSLCLPWRDVLVVALLRELALARGLDSLAGEERLRAGRRALGSTGKSAVLGLVVGVTVGIVLGTTGALMQSKDERWFWIAVFPLAGGIVGAGVGAVAGFATGLVASSAGESFVLPAGDWIVVPNPRAQLLALSP